MTPPFFPNLGFAWVWLAILAGLLVYAAICDLRTTVIPKWLTFGVMVPAGLLFNAIRVAWLATLETPTWPIATASPAVGAIDGLISSLIGLAFGFAFFTLLWIMGSAGGGDVKLFAAIGTWVGFTSSIYIIVVTLIVVGGLLLAQSFRLILSGEFRKLRRRGPRADGKPVKRLITFALPLAISTLIVVAWKCRFELNLAPAPPVVAWHGGPHAQT